MQAIKTERAILEIREGGNALAVYSVWEFSKDERELIARGENLKLGILGIDPMPPVSLEVVSEGMRGEGH